MTTAELNHFKNLLSDREEILVEWLNKLSSREKENATKVKSLLETVRDALGRVGDRTFGECKDCDGTVETYRLEVQPATEVCISCISEEEKRSLEDELFLASKIHRALLPQTVERIEGFEIAASSLSARTVGGDYYDFLPSANNGPKRIVIADTMGKGIPAGLLMSNIQGALRVLSEEIDEPGRLVSRLNQWFCRNVPLTKFVTLTCLSLEQGENGTAKLTYTNAGHTPIVLIRNNGEAELLESTGGLLGVSTDFTYDSAVRTLSAGDTLVLYTDGVSEEENESGEMFEDARVVEYVRENRGKKVGDIVQGLINEVKTFSGKSEFSDDITVLALRLEDS